MFNVQFSECVYDFVFGGLLYPAYIMLTASVIYPTEENPVNKKASDLFHMVK